MKLGYHVYLATCTSSFITAKNQLPIVLWLRLRPTVKRTLAEVCSKDTNASKSKVLILQLLPLQLNFRIWSWWYCSTPCKTTNETELSKSICPGKNSVQQFFKVFKLLQTHNLAVHVQGIYKFTCRCDVYLSTYMTNVYIVNSVSVGNYFVINKKNWATLRSRTDARFKNKK